MAWRCWGKSHHPQGHPLIGVLGGWLPQPRHPGGGDREACKGPWCVSLPNSSFSDVVLVEISIYTMEMGKHNKSGPFPFFLESQSLNIRQHTTRCVLPPRVSRQGQTPAFQSGIIGLIICTLLAACPHLSRFLCHISFTSQINYSH